MVVVKELLNTAGSGVNKPHFSISTKSKFSNIKQIDIIISKSTIPVIQVIGIH